VPEREKGYFESLAEQGFQNNLPSRVYLLSSELILQDLKTNRMLHIEQGKETVSDRIVELQKTLLRLEQLDRE